MIYRVVNTLTGEILRSLDTSLEVAKRYLEPGQCLVTAGGTLQINEHLMQIKKGVLVRKEDAPDMDYPDEGEKATLVFMKE